MAERKSKPKDKAAISLGKRGGAARAKNLTPEQRSKQARAAVTARWAKYKREHGGNATGRGRGKRGGL